MSLIKELTGDPNVTAAEYANAAFEGTLGQRVDSPNGQLWMVQNATWVRLIAAGPGAGVAEFATFFIRKGGNDTTGDGTRTNPFLTIGRGITGVATAADAASTKPYKLDVGAGTFTENWSLNPWTFVVGAGERLTTIANASNAIGAGFSASGIQEAGISKCKIGGDLLVDFAARSSPGQGAFFLISCGWLDSATDLTVTGNNVNNTFFMQNVGTEGISLGGGPTPNLNFNNIDVALGAIGLRNASVNAVNTASYAMKIRQNNSRIGIVNLTCSSTTNFLAYQCEGPLHGYSTPPVLTMTGDGCLANGHLLKYALTTPDANTTYAPGAFASTTRLVTGGWNYLTTTTLTAPRTYTISGDVNTPYTALIYKNESSFAVTWTFPGGTGSVTVPVGGGLHAYVVGGAWHVNLLSGASLYDVASIAEMQAIVAAGLPDGTPCWVRTVQREFVLTTTGAAADATRDTYTSTAGGRLWVGTEHTNTRYWMSQLNWFLDDAGNREDTGADAAHPIPENERYLRMGPNPEWNAGEYHLRYVTDLDLIYLRGSIAESCAIFVHGSTVNGQGQSTLLSGAFDTLVAQNIATNTPWQATVNAIPTSWTASGYITASVTTRLRMTSGAAIGAKFSIEKDLGAKTARLSSGMPRVTAYNLATIKTPAVTYASEVTTIAQNDTFVAEKLTQVKNLQVELQFFQRNLSQTTGLQISDITATPGLVVESMNLGVRDGVEGAIMIQGSRAAIFYDGCLITGYCAGSNDADIVIHGGCATANLSGSHRVAPRSLYMHGCSIGEMFVPDIVADNNGVVFFKNWTMQGNGTLSGLRCYNKFRLEAFRLGGFDCTYVVRLRWGSQMTFHVEAAGNPAFWGSGNSTGFELQPQCLVTYPSGTGAGFTLAATNQIAFQSGGKTQARAYDDSLGLFTQLRTMSFANLLAAVSAGGFGEQIHDPSNGCYFGVSGTGQQ